MTEGRSLVQLKIITELLNLPNFQVISVLEQTGTSIHLHGACKKVLSEAAYYPELLPVAAHLRYFGRDQQQNQKAETNGLWL